MFKKIKNRIWNIYHKGEFGIIPLFFFICLLTYQPGNASQIEKEIKAKSTKTAMIKSAIMPGWGQWYNGQKFKAVLVLGGEIGLIGVAVVQNQRARSSKNDAERVWYQDDRSSFLWYAGAFWLLSIIDAHVDAKLREFDISEDLSIVPARLNNVSIGLRMSYRF